MSRIVVFSGIVCLSLHVLALADSVVFEDDFESGDPAARWRFVAARGTCFGRIDSENALSGRRSLRLSIPNDVTARAQWRLIRNIPVKPDTDYEFSFQLLSLNVSGEVYGILYENGLERPDRWHLTPKVNGSADWSGQTVRFRTREDAKFLRLVLKLRHGTGYVWFDDVRLIEFPPEPRRVPPRVLVPPEDDGFPLQAMWTPAQWTRGGVLSLARGHLNPLSLFFRGARERLREPALVIDTPAGITVRGPLRRGRGPAPPDTPDRIVFRDGRAIATFALDPVYLARGRFGRTFHWENYFHLDADVTPEAPAAGELRWHFVNAGTTGPTHTLRLTVTENIPPPLVCPPDFQILVQHTGALRTPRGKARARLVRQLRSAGIGGGLGLSFYEPDRIAWDRQLQALGFAPHTWRFEGYYGACPDDRRCVMSSGKVSKARVCPLAQLERVNPWYDNLRNYYKTKLAGGLKRIIIDYEPPTRHACFCPRCRAAFAKKFGLDAAELETMSPRQILADPYAAKWGAFRAGQNGAIVALHSEIIHSIDPAVKIGLCSWPGTAAAAANGGDIRRFDPCVSWHMPMIYTKGTAYFDTVTETCARTAKPVLPFVELSDLSQPRCLSPGELRLNLLATGLAGGKGAVLWVGIECLDADYMAMVARAVREIRDLRRLVPYSPRTPDWLTVGPEQTLARTITVDGKPVKIQPPTAHPQLRWRIWGNGERAMIAVLNYDPRKSRTLVIRFGNRTRKLTAPPADLASLVVTAP